MFSSIALAGMAKSHPAGTVTDGTFPGNYTFNGTVNMTPTGVAGTAFYMNSTGSIGIGTAGPSYHLEVNGNVKVGTYLYVGANNHLIGDYVSSFTARLEVNGTFNATSNGGNLLLDSNGDIRVGI